MFKFKLFLYIALTFIAFLCSAICIIKMLNNRDIERLRKESICFLGIVALLYFICLFVITYVF